jgi:hypothetical protein
MPWINLDNICDPGRWSRHVKAIPQGYLSLCLDTRVTLRRPALRLAVLRLTPTRNLHKIQYLRVCTYILHSCPLHSLIPCEKHKQFRAPGVLRSCAMGDRSSQHHASPLQLEMTTAGPARSIGPGTGTRRLLLVLAALASCVPIKAAGFDGFANPQPVPWATNARSIAALVRSETMEAVDSWRSPESPNSAELLD